jgi:hypothetical protein
MRWGTFDRKMDQVEAAEAVCNGNLLRFVSASFRNHSSFRNAS